MRGYYPQPNLNQYEIDKWVGKTVNINGSDVNGVVQRAFWGGFGKPTTLFVEWYGQAALDGCGPSWTDSEHVTIVREA